MTPFSSVTTWKRNLNKSKSLSPQKRKQRILKNLNMLEADQGPISQDFSSQWQFVIHWQIKWHSWFWLAMKHCCHGSSQWMTSCHRWQVLWNGPPGANPGFMINAVCTVIFMCINPPKTPPPFFSFFFVFFFNNKKKNKIKKNYSHGWPKKGDLTPPPKRSKMSNFQISRPKKEKKRVLLPPPPPPPPPPRLFSGWLSRCEIFGPI